MQEPEIPKRVKVPDYAKLLPGPIQKFTMPAAIQDADHLRIQGHLATGVGPLAYRRHL